MADAIPAAEELPFVLQPIGPVMVVEFRQPSLMDQILIERTGRHLTALIDEQDRRRIILDFERVQYLSSQAIGVLLTMKRKLDALGNGRLVLCGIGPRLADLLKITKLDRVLTIKPTQKEALAMLQI